MIKIPTHCPVCKADLIFQGKYLICPNKFGCISQVSGRVKTWVSDLNILELGEGVIDKLVESGLVKDPSDLYTLTIDQMAGLERMGKKSATNIHKSLWSVNPISLAVFIGALSIPGIGSSTITLLVDSGYDNLEKLQELKLNQVMAVKGFGDVRAESFINGMKENADIISKLLANGVKIKEKIVGNLSNLSFVFTGTLSIRRPILEQLVIDNGGVVKGSVSSGVSYLVINDINSTSSKAIAAKKHGTTLISESDFMKLINK